MNIQDPTAESRKNDHIELAFQSQVNAKEVDNRFYYEPMLSAHPKGIQPVSFLGKTLSAPIWVSSMTGGTQMAKKINHNLAKACAEFGMGMGLGSCRALLDSNDYLEDFNVRSIIGDNLPLYANIGIAQLNQLLENNKLFQINDLLDKLSADGIFIHVNPLQEWLQPEGDAISEKPLDSIKELIDKYPNINIIVKEVGQGMGKASLEALMQLPIQAIEFAANGGTNFSKLELLRNTEATQEHYMLLSKIGHTANDMVEMVNEIKANSAPNQFLCDNFIISGGIKNFLDGYYLIQKINATAVYGQASMMLKYAAVSYEALQEFLTLEIDGLALAEAYLKIRK
jgi:isopentenyl-diphosphate delta-isomerase